MFGIGGEHDLTERELPHLPGWRDSAPVRVGNGAWNQRQLDVYGELLNAVYRFSDHARRASSAVDEGVPRRSAPTPRPRRAGTNSDQGIWEVRGEPRDFVYSKLMCWVALERAVALADRLDARRPGRRRGRRRADEIREAILSHGWSDGPAPSRSPSAPTISTPPT